MNARVDIKAKLVKASAMTATGAKIVKKIVIAGNKYSKQDKLKNS